jgi:hypothetical protein
MLPDIPPSPIAHAHKFDIAAIRHELATSPEPVLMAKYHIGLETLRTWQRWYRQKSMRFCRRGQHYQPYDNMKRTLNGALLQMCLDCENPEERPQPRNPLPATNFRSLVSWVQGGLPNLDEVLEQA